ncbi:unnamed protein product [Lupinus luteus]|uniref:Uncharacterized protein n=1 Tax=Lupinus luteus TaxID=3873 RepID=A0AAV1WVX5_LUPLU
MANKDWSFGFNYTDWWSRFENHHLNKTEQESKKNVGGGWGSAVQDPVPFPVPSIKILTRGK